MKSLLTRAALLITLSVVARPLQLWAAPDATSSEKTRVLLVYGGHGFDTNQFFQVFKENSSITFKAVEQPQAQAWFAADRAREYDVLVFYDMWEKMPDEAKASLTARVKEGKGLVALHHCLCSFQSWDEFKNLIGGKSHLQKWAENGVEKPASTYLHDVDFKVHVADPNHPVTRGLQDFAIHDETYGGFEVGPESHVLLTTDAPTSGRSISWTKNYGAGRVVYIQLGHDHQAYENPNYQRLVKQAIAWTASTRAP